MTLINIDHINGVVIFSAAGHAQYSFDHNDIVCAAISALTQTLLQTVKYYDKLGELKLLEEKIDEDIGLLTFSFTSRNQDIADAVMNMARIGLTMLKKSYPKYIKIKIN